MALFNPDVGATNPPDMTNRSGGPVANRTLATRIQGFAENLAATTNVIDTRNQINIRNEAETAVDFIRTQYGVDQATAAAMPSLFVLPETEQLARSAEFLDDLTVAYQSGQFPESHYYAQLNAVVRSLKARYPGYTSQIDNTIREITGITPANSLLYAIRDEAMAGLADNEDAQDVFQWIDDHEAVLGAIAPGFMALPPEEQLAAARRGSPLREQVAQYVSVQAEQDRLEAESAIDITTSNRNMETALSNIYTAMMEQAQVLAGDTMGDDRIPTPEEMAQHLIDMNLVTADGNEVEAAFDYIHRSIEDMRTAMYNAVFAFPHADRELAREVIEGYLAPMEAYIDAIRTGNEDMVKLLDNAIAHRENSIYQILTEEYGDILAVVGVMQEVLPEFMMENLVNDNIGEFAGFGTLLAEFLTVAIDLGDERAMNAATALGIEITTNPDGTRTFDLNQLITQLGNSLGITPAERREATAELAGAVINGNIEIITRSNDPEEIARVVTQMYGEGGLALTNFPAEERLAAYSRLTSPDVVAAIQTHATPEQFGQFTRWAIESFGTINRQTIVDINAHAATLEEHGLTLTFNTATGQFVPLNMTNTSFRDGGANIGALTVDPNLPMLERDAIVRSYRALNESITYLNTSLASMGPILDANDMTWQGNTLNSLLSQAGGLEDTPITMVNNDVLGNPIVTESAGATGDGRVEPPARAQPPDPAAADMELGARLQRLFADGMIAPERLVQLIQQIETDPEGVRQAIEQLEPQVLGDKTADADIKIELSEWLGQVQENAITTTASDFLIDRLEPGHASEHITGMNPELQTNLTAFFQAAPPEIAEGLGILSGYRSEERQRQLYEEKIRQVRAQHPNWSESRVIAEARRWVAPPGSSQHNHGNAADLTWNGASLSQAPGWVVTWLHQNAPDYGLVFPLSNENWHIELEGARGG